MTTIREVARHAGVSPSTVSHVINETRFVSEDVRQRVLAAMQELDYHPNVLARSLRRGETCTLGLILPDSANPFFAEMARAVELSAHQQGYSVVFCNTEDDPDKEARYVEVLINKQIDGLIFIAAGDHSASISPLRNHIPPLVLVDRDLSDVQFSTVLADNYQGGCLAAQHLLAGGYRRIACIAGPSNLTPSAQRLTGFLDGLRQVGQDCPPEWIIHGDFHPSSGYQAAQELLNRPVPPDGIFACNDLMAIGALRAAMESGRLIPGDLGIVGFDDIELAAYASPPLSTIAQPKLEMARQAVALLLEQLSNSSLPARRLVLPTRMIQRQSTRSML